MADKKFGKEKGGEVGQSKGSGVKEEAKIYFCLISFTTIFSVALSRIRLSFSFFYAFAFPFFSLLFLFLSTITSFHHLFLSFHLLLSVYTPLSMILLSVFPFIYFFDSFTSFPYFHCVSISFSPYSFIHLPFFLDCKLVCSGI